MSKGTIVLLVTLALCCSMASAFVFPSYSLQFTNRVTVGNNDVLPLARNADGTLIDFDDTVCQPTMYRNSLRYFQREDVLDLVFCGADGSITVLNEGSKASAAGMMKGVENRWVHSAVQSRVPNDTYVDPVPAGYYSYFYGSLEGRSQVCSNKLGALYRVPLSAEYAFNVLSEVPQAWTATDPVTSAVRMTALLSAERGSPLTIEENLGYSVLSIGSQRRFPSIYGVAKSINDEYLAGSTPPTQGVSCSHVDNEIRLIARNYDIELNGAGADSSEYLDDIVANGFSVPDGSQRFGMDFIQDPMLASIDIIKNGVDGSRYEKHFLYPGDIRGSVKDDLCAAQLGKGWAAATLAELQNSMSRGFDPRRSSTFNRFETPQLCGDQVQSIFTGAKDAFADLEMVSTARFAETCQFPSIVVRDTCTAVTPLAFDIGCDSTSLDTTEVPPVPDADKTLCQPVLAPTRDVVSKCRTAGSCSEACTFDGGNEIAYSSSTDLCSTPESDELPWSLTDIRPDWYKQSDGSLSDYPRFEDGYSGNYGFVACVKRRTDRRADRYGRGREEYGCRSPPACQRRNTIDDQLDEFPVNDIVNYNLGEETTITLNFAADGSGQKLRLPLNRGIDLLSNVGYSSKKRGVPLTCEARGCSVAECTAACFGADNCFDDAVRECPQNFRNTENEFVKAAAAGYLEDDVTALNATIEIFNPQMIRVPARFLTQGAGATTVLRLIEHSGNFNSTDNPPLFWVTGCGSTDHCSVTSTPNPNFAGYTVFYNGPKYGFTFPGKIFNNGVDEFAVSGVTTTCDLFVVVGFTTELVERPDPSEEDDMYSITLGGTIVRSG